MKKEKLDIIYEDKNYIVVNKPAHLLTIATDKGTEPTLYHKVHDYVYKKNKNNKIFIVHRLDKDTSGVVLFTKNPKLKEEIQNNWDNYAEVREYYAVVEGRMSGSGKIVEYLLENKQHNVYATKKGEGHIAITNYEVVKVGRNYTLLKINISTGRKNQIRVGLANLGHPIIGDKKYGSNVKYVNMLLHASKLTMFDPLSQKSHDYIAPMPKYFETYMQ
ncbi:MAG TPA: RNA pseudouridine synthase [Bacilli bacterium]|mgnify:CR=1 FL=1|nr:RNA pseudouridine synthase [Bacilli bacterium]